jgi:hypothetical protein
MRGTLCKGQAGKDKEFYVKKAWDRPVFMAYKQVGDLQL